jgi:hypothetical protein
VTDYRDGNQRGAVQRAIQDALDKPPSVLTAMPMPDRQVFVPVPPDHDRKTAEATKSMDTKLSDLVDAMHQTIEINQQAQAAAAQSERFSRRMSVTSLWVAIGSLAAAVASIVVAIIALTTGH